MFSFPGQQGNEKVLFLVHKAFVIFLRIIALFFIIIILPLILFSLVFFSVYNFSDYYVMDNIVIFFCIWYFLYGFSFFIVKIINDEFDVFILTDERIVDVTQVNFLKRTMTSTPLEQIQDTTGSINGFLPTLFSYGDLVVQTASGNASDFSIKDIPNPNLVAQRILNLAQDKRKKNL